MGIKSKDLRRLIVETLTPHGLWSKAVEELLILTCAAESNGGEYLYQIGGPARGIFQMEPATEQDIWDNYLEYRPNLKTIFDNVPRDLVGSIRYQILIARVFYLRHTKPIPEWNNPKALSQYYKDLWNTKLGAAKPEETLRKYLQYR